MPNNGLRDFERRLAALSRAAIAGVQPALDKSAEELVIAQKQLVPVDKGDLRDSIEWKKTGELRRTVTAGGAKTTKEMKNPKGVSYHYDHANAQEFGTRKMPANPFFWPAYRLLKKRINRRIKTAISKSVKKTFQNG